MKKILVNTSLFVSASLLFACATVNIGNVTGNAALSSNNFRYVGTVSASSTSTYVLGIGGMNKQNQVEMLRKELATLYPLRGGLAWANVGVSFSNSYYIFFNQRVATLSLDLVDFWPDTNASYKGFEGYYLIPDSFIIISAPPKSISISTPQIPTSVDTKFKLIQLQSKVNGLWYQKIKWEALKVGDILLINENDYLFVGIIETVDSQNYSVQVKCLNNQKALVYKRIPFTAIVGLVTE
jgi:hypothetical protein